MFELLEPLASQFFGENTTPFPQSGAIFFALLVICSATGLLLLKYYVPDPDVARGFSSELAGMGTGLKMLYVSHGVSANLCVLALLVHLLRVWARKGFLWLKRPSWFSAITLLPLLGIIGWSGYVLLWDERAVVLLSWGRELVHSVNKWPIIGWLHIGTLLGNPIFTGTGENSILLNIFAIHIGGAFLGFVLVYFHFKKMAKSRLVAPTMTWLVLIVVVMFVSSLNMDRIANASGFNWLSVPGAVQVDGIINFPLLFYQSLGAPLLSALVTAVWLGISFIPKIGKRVSNAAAVIESNCTGCRICEVDCPYDAIEMLKHSNLIKRLQGREIARVKISDCTGCGICVGSCDFDAIEIPDLQASVIESRMEMILKHDEIMEPEKVTLDAEL